MSKIYSNYKTYDGIELYYEIIKNDAGEDNGFSIYYGKDRKYPDIYQPEPYIPRPELSYEENALLMCKNISEQPAPEEPSEENTPANISVAQYNELQANVDYLMLISDGAF